MDPQLKTMIDNMPAKTGKSLEEWLQILSTKQFEKHSHALKFLKEEHGVTHGFANTIVHLSKADANAEVDLVANQYKGKEALKPIFDALSKEIDSFGKDIEFAPKKAYVSIRRKKQFAIIQPSTKTRVDLGLNIKEKAPEGELLAAGSWNSMCSHRVKLSATAEITPEVIAWLKEAYEAAG